MKISEHIKFLIDYHIRQIDSNKMMHHNNLSTIFLILLGTLLLFVATPSPIAIFAQEGEEEEEKEAEQEQEQKDPEEIEKVQEEITELETEINEQKADGKEVDAEDLEKLNELQNELKTVNGGEEVQQQTTTTTTTTSPLIEENTSATTTIPTVPSSTIQNLTSTSATTATTNTNTSSVPENCNCTQLENGTLIPIEPPIVNSTEPEEPEPGQIIITKDMIQDFTSFGEITNPLYIKEYNATNTVDNSPITFWSQYGQAGFTINFKKDALKNYAVCSAEVNIHDPKMTPYTLSIGISKTVSGILDSLTETPLNVQDDSACITNPSKIAMTFNGPDKYTSLSEVKLFGNVLEPLPPTPTTPGEPPIVIDGKNISKIDIKNSKVEINIENSEVSFNFGSHAFKLLPNAKVIPK